MNCCHLTALTLTLREHQYVAEALIYTKDDISKQIKLSISYSSFEVNLFELCSAFPVLCAVHRPPKHNKDFIGDFVDFLAGIMPNYNWILIVGDFNIHVFGEWHVCETNSIQGLLSLPPLSFLLLIFGRQAYY